MGCLGNILWFLFGGLWQGLSWTLAGVLWSITIIGIPIGRQCFKLASLAFFPFGKSCLAFQIWCGEKGKGCKAKGAEGIPFSAFAALFGILYRMGIFVNGFFGRRGLSPG